MTFLQIEKILKADGWFLIRTLDSIHQYRKVGVEDSVLVPDCKENDISIGIIDNIEKKTGLSLQR